jgi:hypothetical protein
MLNRSFPNQFTGRANASTTSTESAFAFGFDATFIRILNDKATAVYADFSTGSESGLGTTDGVRTCASEALDIRGVKSAGVAFAGGTTTTGTFVNVYALGG